jgi:hypothetical protein
MWWAHFNRTVGPRFDHFREFAILNQIISADDDISARATLADRFNFCNFIAFGYRAEGTNCRFEYPWSSGCHSRALACGRDVSSLCEI